MARWPFTYPVQGSSPPSSDRFVNLSTSFISNYFNGNSLTKGAAGLCCTQTISAAIERGIKVSTHIQYLSLLKSHFKLFKAAHQLSNKALDQSFACLCLVSVFCNSLLLTQQNWKGFSWSIGCHDQSHHLLFEVHLQTPLPSVRCFFKTYLLQFKPAQSLFFISLDLPVSFLRGWTSFRVISVNNIFTCCYPTQVQ